MKALMFLLVGLLFISCADNPIESLPTNQNADIVANGLFQLYRYHYEDNTVKEEYTLDGQCITTDFRIPQILVNNKRIEQLDDYEINFSSLGELIYNFHSYNDLFNDSSLSLKIIDSSISLQGTVKKPVYTNIDSIRLVNNTLRWEYNKNNDWYAIGIYAYDSITYNDLYSYDTIVTTNYLTLNNVNNTSFTVIIYSGTGSLPTNIGNPNMVGSGTGHLYAVTYYDVTQSLDKKSFKEKRLMSYIKNKLNIGD